MSHSNTSLPAERVAKACRLAIEDIQSSRIRIVSDASEKYRATGLPFVRHSREWAVRQLTDIELDLARRHRADEERIVSALLDISLATAHDDPDMRISITTSDFSLVADFYHLGEVADDRVTVTELRSGLTKLDLDVMHTLALHRTHREMGATYRREKLARLQPPPKKESQGTLTKLSHGLSALAESELRGGRNV